MNKQTFSTPTLSALKVIILALVLGLGISYAQAVWQGPTAPPTGNNVDAPINVGPSYQTKLGSVSINTTTSNPDPYGLDVFGISRFFGKVGIGTASPAVALDVVGEARSSTSTIASSNAKTLVTKDYVDAIGAGLGVGSVVTFMLPSSDSGQISTGIKNNVNDHNGLPTGWVFTSAVAINAPMTFTVPANSGVWKGIAMNVSGWNGQAMDGRWGAIDIPNSTSVQTVSQIAPSGVWFWRLKRIS